MLINFHIFSIFLTFKINQFGEQNEPFFHSAVLLKKSKSKQIGESPDILTIDGKWQAKRIEHFT